MIKIKKCDFCKKENKTVRTLAFPYTAMTHSGASWLPLICDDCKKILDKNKVIRDSTGKSTYTLN